MRPKHRTAPLLAALGLTIAGCGRESPPPEVVSGQTVTVRAEPVRRGRLADSITGTGKVVPAASADMTVQATEPARIQELPKGVGDAVALDDVLVRYEIPAITEELATRTAEVDQASAALRGAQAELDRLMAQYDRGIIARNLLDAARTSVADATTTLNLARTRLDAARMHEGRTVVKARFAGVVVERWHNVDDPVGHTAAADPIIRIVDPTRLQVALPLSSSELQRIILGQAVALRLPGSPDQEGMVVQKPTTVDPLVNIGEVRINFKTPTTLPPDSAIEVDILLDKRDAALIVPRTALLKDEAGSYVFIAVDGMARRRDVRTGLLTRDMAEITSGLEAGDQLILTALDQMAEGQPVTIGG